MRCPKCGFISFDHLENCLKCKKNIKSTSEILQGSVYNVAAPAFLYFHTEPEVAEVDAPEDASDADDIFSNGEIRDPDLDILLNDDEEGKEAEIFLDTEDDSDEIELNLGSEELEEDDIDISLADEEEDGEISFSLDQFDDDEYVDNVEGKPLNMGLPEELSDISDLEQPSLENVAEEKIGLADDDFDLAIDFDLDLADQDLAVPEIEESKSDLANLDLADLDFDTESKAVETKKKPASDDIGGDDDLNFDLDLGDLSLDDD